MKRIILQLCTLSLLLCLLACSKEQSTSEPILTQAATTQGVQLEVALTADAETPRVYQNISTSPKTTPVLSESNLKVRVVVSYEGVATHQTVTFTKVPNENKAKFVGKITVPSVGDKTYTITAAILGQEDGKEYTKVLGDDKLQVIPTTTLLTAQNNIVNSTVPYIAQANTKLSSDRKALEKTTLTFKPSGTLLQIKLTNWTGVTQKFTKIKVKTNAFATNWSYDLTNLTGGNLKAGESVGTEVEQEFNLPEPIEVKDGALAPQTYYMWVMPTKLTTGLKTTIYAINDKAKVIRALKRSTPVKEGLLTAHIKPIPPMPLDYLKQDALVGTGEPFSFTSGASPTYYAPEEVHNLARLGDITIGNEQYYMPTANEIRSILHERNFAIGPNTADAKVAGGLAVPFSNVSFPWNPTVNIKGTSIYFSDGVNTVYGLRFITDDFRYLMAYRYEWVGTFAVTSPDSKLRITSRYLGEDYKTATIADIANDAFWETDKEEDATAELRTHGYVEYNPLNYGGDLLQTEPVVEAGQNAYIYARPSVIGQTTPVKNSQGNWVDVHYAEFFRVDRQTGIWGARSLRIDQRPTRLFIRK